MKYLPMIAALGLAACAPKPEPITDASIYDGGKAGSLLPLAQEADRCWNKWGQHNNYPGCPWFAEGGGGLVVSPNEGEPDRDNDDVSIPDDDDGWKTTKFPDGIFFPGPGAPSDPSEPSEPSDPSDPSDPPTGGNPGNDKPVGSSNDKRPDHAKPDDGEKGNSDNKPSKKCGCKKVSK